MKKAVLILFAFILGLGQSFAELTKDDSWYNAEADIFTIEDAAQLGTFAEMVNSGNDFSGKTIIIKGDITIPLRWTPIGTADNPFNGTFDGQGFSILDYCCLLPEEENLGFFGYIGENGTVKNLHIEGGGDVWGETNVGILAGLSKGTIENCSVNSIYGFMTHGVGGGLVGKLDRGFIRNCSASVNVSGEGKSISLGGLIGIMTGDVIHSFATGNVDGKADKDEQNSSCYLGGLVGQQANWSTIEECYAIGDVSGIASKVNIGGLAGYQVTDVINCYSTGDITCEAESFFAGGFTGYHHSGEITNCYSAGKITIVNGSIPQYSGAGGLVGLFEPVGSINTCYFDYEKATYSNGIGRITSSSGDVTPKTTAEMGRRSTYQEWDFAKIWELKEGNDYPTLRMGESEGIDEPEPPITEDWWDDSWYKDKISPYTIKTERQLATFAKLVSTGEDDFTGKTVLLNNDLDLSLLLTQYADYFLTEGWRPIGIETLMFNGTFDGKENTVRGLQINNTDPDIYDIGLFGMIGATGIVKNLIITECGDISGGIHVGILAGASFGDISNCIVESDSQLIGQDHIGGLVGTQYRGTITDCSANSQIIGIGNRVIAGGLVGSFKGIIYNSNSSGSIKTNYQTIPNNVYAGGLVGESSGDISRSFSHTEVIGNAIGTSSYTGGFIGFQWDGQIEECYATGYTEATALNANVGGFIGFQSTPIKNCYATGKVLAEGQSLSIGGFVGSYHSGPLVNCYSSGQIQSIGGNTYNQAGGFMGYLNYDDIENCYFDKEKSGKTNGIGYATSNLTADITAKTTVEMGQTETFNNWDFYGIWQMDDTIGYPVLRMGNTEIPPEQKEYSISLNIATYIKASLETDIYKIKKGDEFKLEFYLENTNDYTDKDILFLLNGEEIDFERSNNPGTAYSFTLENIQANHTIEIALKTYKVIIPQIEGLLTNPEAGTYNIPYGEPFTITFTLEDKYDQSVVVVLINGKVVDLSALRSTSFTYTIDKVLEPITIEVKGIELNDPTSNGTVNPHSVDIYTSNGAIYLKTNTPLPIEVYSISGILIKSLTVMGEEQINLSPGIYIIRSLSDNYKVIVK